MSLLAPVGPGLSLPDPFSWSARLVQVMGEARRRWKSAGDFVVLRAAVQSTARIGSLRPVRLGMLPTSSITRRFASSSGQFDESAQSGLM